MSILVSIVLPFYNAASTLSVAVSSILAQTMSEWELLLVDDGSSDGSSEQAKAFAEKDARIRLISLPHGGIVSALNAGCDLAQGAFIARMDADDYCVPTRLVKQVAYLQSHPEVGVVGCQVAFGGDRVQHAGYAAHVDWMNELLTPDEHFQNRFVDAPVAHPSVMWRKGMAEGYREGAFPEDFELWLRWMDEGVLFAKLPEVLMTWNDLPDRLSRQEDRYAPDAFYRIKCQYLNKVLPDDRPIWLWGAGRVSRRRFSGLDRLEGYVDVDPKKFGQRLEGVPVQNYRELPENAFVLSGVANRGVRNKIQAYLQSTGRVSVRDYYLCA
ncbi:glycosyltransferase family 2 protein [Kiritimatiellota bacterium B12222]|nr:glycosyltransferase family 2 protein [Kiritimatiellota bacterium B12222]